MGKKKKKYEAAILYLEVRIPFLKFRLQEVLQFIFSNLEL